MSKHSCSPIFKLNWEVGFGIRFHGVFIQTLCNRFLSSKRARALPRVFFSLCNNLGWKSQCNLGSSPSAISRSRLVWEVQHNFLKSDVFCYDPTSSILLNASQLYKWFAPWLSCWRWSCCQCFTPWEPRAEGITPWTSGSALGSQVIMPWLLDV